MEKPHFLCEEFFLAALQASQPDKAVRDKAAVIRQRFRVGGFNRLWLVGFGKAATTMSGALAEELGDLLTGGIIVTKYGHVDRPLPRQLRVYEAGHPVPDNNGLHATAEVLRLLQGADKETLVVALVSGGGSALLVAPWHGLSLADKQQTTSLLLRAGADIFELNTVRKHLSRIKGGRLSETAYPASVIALLLSDVIGDRLDVIASGPTSADPTTYADALNILARYQLTDLAPPSVMELLQRGSRGEIPETPKAGSQFLLGVENLIVGSNRQALEAAAQVATEKGFVVEIVSDALVGEARDVGQELARQALAAKRGKPAGTKRCLLYGGETTVTVRGQGMGGRNLELALAFAMGIERENGITFLSAGTDGTDGPTDAAGAIVDGNTLLSARQFGLDAQAALADNDSYPFFNRAGGLFKTGATGTNVMDLQILLLT